MTARTLLLAVVLAALATPTHAQQSTPFDPPCTTPRKVVIVHLDHTTRDGDPPKHIAILRHARAAIARGEPEVWHIARFETQANRAASLRGIPTWGELTTVQRQAADPDDWWRPHDRDEFPPAMMDEGGAGADVAYVDSSANRSAGSVMGRQLAPYCDGTRVRYERLPGPKPRP
jgi:Deoxyribonuclease NucA/NucB